MSAKIVVILSSCIVFCSLSILSSATSIQECCQVATTDERCNDTCFKVLLDHSSRSLVSLTATESQALSSACSPSYSTFWSCITSAIEFNSTDVTSTESPPSQRYSACCNLSDDQTCMVTCLETFRFNDNDLSNSRLINACGPPPRGKMWACLISVDSTSTSTLGPPSVRFADWPRIQCCYKALDNSCRDSCLDLYSGQVSSNSWTTFQLDCIHRPSEISLTTCLADVSGTCQLGCSGMQFCRNFNNRPTHLFRQCITSADRLAKRTYNTWINQGRLLHPQMTLLIPNIQNCLPEEWKAVSCITHLQPCHSRTHTTQICRKDCLRLLSQCTNSTAMRYCDILAATSFEADCISLDQFLTPSVYGNDVVSPIADIVDSPCDPNPCSKGFFCSINRICDDDDPSCTKFICQQGCVVGTSPGIVLPNSTRVRVSMVSHAQQGCYGYLNCTANAADLLSNDENSFVNPIINGECETQERCYSSGTSYDHDSKFWLNCNFCVCNFGRIVCTNRTCTGNQTSVFDCDCPSTYSPVCTRDEITIANECQAQCFGYRVEDYHRGDCGSVAKCYNSQICGGASRCIPHRHSCLSTNVTQCPQYKCESLPQCLRQTSPVCDVLNNQHNTLCSFLLTNEEFNYFGSCEATCSDDVCGVNGETFQSECHAHDANILVDYYGRCHSIPGSGSDNISCDQVKCPALSHPGCRHVIPWGSCCPLCGSVVTIVRDNVILSKNLLSLQSRSFSSTDIIQRLQYFLRYRQCELFGHFSVDGSLTVIIIPSKLETDELLIEVCYKEALKLATFINNRIPAVASDPFLSHFVAAHVTEGTRQNTTNVVNTTTPSNSSAKLAEGTFFQWFFLTVNFYLLSY